MEKKNAINDFVIELRKGNLAVAKEHLNTALTEKYESKKEKLTTNGD